MIKIVDISSSPNEVVDNVKGKKGSNRRIAGLIRRKVCFWEKYLTGKTRATKKSD